MRRQEKLLRRAQQSLPIEKRGERIRPVRKERKDVSAIKPGTKVLYWQPGIDEIMSSWAKSPVRAGDPGGTLKEVTIKSVSSDDDHTYYQTEEGVMLRDTDIREVIA